MPDARQAECHQEANKKRKGCDGRQLRQKPKKHHQKPSLSTGKETDSRAGGSAKKEQRSLPEAKNNTVASQISYRQEDNLALNVPVPKQMTCLFVDKITCVHVRRILGSPESLTTLAKPYGEALVSSTQKGHRRILSENLPETEAPLDVTLVSLYQHFQRERSWVTSTLLTKMAQAQGALRLIFLYRQTECTVSLKESVRWKVAMKGVAVELQRHTPAQPKAITEEQVEEVRRLCAPQMSALVELSWLVAGRGGDVLQLLSTDIKDKKSFLSITFCRENGKATAVHCRNPPAIRVYNGLPAKAEVLGITRNEGRKPEGGPPDGRSGIRTEEPEARPPATPGGGRVDRSRAPGGVPSRDAGYASISGHGFGIPHKRENGAASIIPSSKRRLQGFLEGNFGDEDCPSAEDMQKAFPGLRQYQKRHLPIMIKKVETMKEAALWSLTSEYKECLLCMHSINGNGSTPRSPTEPSTFHLPISSTQASQQKRSA